MARCPLPARHLGRVGAACRADRRAGGSGHRTRPGAPPLLRRLPQRPDADRRDHAAEPRSRAHRRGRPRDGGLGEGHPQARHPLDAAGGSAQTGRGHLRRADRVDRGPHRRGRGDTPRPRPAPRRAPAEPRRVRQRDSRPARPRHRRADAAAAGRFRLRLRQHRRRAVGLADADRALPGRVAQDRAAGGRRSGAPADDRGLRGRQEPAAERAGRRRAAVRLARGAGRPTLLPGRRRVRGEDLPAADLRRPRPRAAGAAHAGGAARRGARRVPDGRRPGLRRGRTTCPPRSPERAGRRPGGALRRAGRPGDAGRELRRSAGLPGGHAAPRLPRHQLRVRRRPDRPAGHRQRGAARAVPRHRAGRHAEPAARLHLPSCHGRGRDSLRHRDRDAARPAGVPARGDRPRRRDAARLLRGGPRRAETSTRASRWRCGASL